MDIFDQCQNNNSNTKNVRRNRNRKFIWFNTLYSQNAKTNIGKLFIKLARKHLLKIKKYHKIFTLNTLKLSCCCTTNVGNIIKQHNSKVLSKTNDNNNPKYICRSRKNCPINGECVIQCLVNKVTSKTSSISFVYYGTSEGEFKTRYSNLTKSFGHRDCMNDTTLSKLKWPWSWQQSITENPYTGLTIPVGLKTLQSMFVGKSFHHLFWPRHFTKQKKWTDLLVSPQK